MNRELLVKHVSDFYAKGVDLVSKKSHDYGNSDALANLKAADGIGIDPRLGIVVRLQDKLSRLANHAQRRSFKVDETIEDTLLDIANYCALYHALHYGPAPVEKTEIKQQMEIQAEIPVLTVPEAIEAARMERVNRIHEKNH